MNGFGRILLLPLICVVSLITACRGDASQDSALARVPRQASVDGYMPANVRAAFRRSCASCHGIDARGIRSVAPNLKNSKQRSPEQWEVYLRSTTTYAHPSLNQPPLWLNDDEVKAFAVYLSRLNQGE